MNTEKYLYSLLILKIDIINRTRYHGGADRIPHHKYGIYSCRIKHMRDSQAETSKETTSLSSKSPSNNSCNSKSSRAITGNEQTSETQGDKLNAMKKWRDMQHIIQHKQKTVNTKVAKRLH